MLVVSRKPNQKITFPHLDITVEILRVSGKAVRIGIDAPEKVRVMRTELLSDKELHALKDEQREQRHDFRNRVYTAQLALLLLQKQLESGLISDAEESLAEALSALSELDSDASHQAKPAKSEVTSVPKRALIVEDNANERELLAGYLRLCGYQVDTVEDGICAMDYLALNDRPDLVLLDMQMPRMDGRATVSAIRNNPDYRDLKLFAVSGMDRQDMKVPLGDRGVNRWFEKTLNPAHFASELGACAEASN